MPKKLDASSAAELAKALVRLQANVISEPRRSQQKLQEILASATAIGAKAQEVQALLELCRCYFLQGQHAQTLDLALKALSISRAERMQNLECHALNSVGLYYQRQGELDQAMFYLLDGLRLAQQISDKEIAARTLSNIALIYSNFGDHSFALKLNEQALELSQSFGHAMYTANILTSIIGTHILLGNERKVLELVDEAIEFTSKHGFHRFESAARMSLASVLLKLRRFSAALRVVSTGIQVASKSRDAESIAVFTRLEGQALLGTGQLEEAESKLKNSLKLSKALKHPIILSNAHSAIADFYDEVGNEFLSNEHRSIYRQIQSNLQGKIISPQARAVITQLQERIEHLDQQNRPSWHSELQEITQSLKQANMELAHRAAYDQLTGVLNRAHTQVRLQQMLNFLNSNDLLGIAIINVDHMKSVNDLYGHALGDALLAEVARRLTDTLRVGDVVGRLGNDEFVIILNFLGHPDDIKIVLDKVLERLRMPFYLMSQELNVTTSMGGVIAPQDGKTVEEILGHADLALRQVKKSGRNNQLIFKPNMNAEERQRRALIFDLHSAVKRQELRLYYQPQFHTSERRLFGMEALVRWQHPRLGLLGPGQFIPLAEESQLILEIGDWVLNEACRQAREWQLDQRQLTVSVNVSPLQFGQQGFVQNVREALGKHHLKGDSLVLELTESMVHHNVELARSHLDALQKIGVQVALDDFGTGYSSLSLLQNMPFKILKLDRSFLRDLRPDSATFERSRLLVQITTQLAQGMDMQVVAEGVEHAEQYDLLGKLNCDLAQGYWLARPAPADQVTSYLN